jgi:hypothetical protein
VKAGRRSLLLLGDYRMVWWRRCLETVSRDFGLARPFSAGASLLLSVSMPWYEAVFRREDGDEVVDPMGIQMPLVYGDQWRIQDRWWRIVDVANSKTRGKARRITFAPSQPPPGWEEWPTHSRL